MAFDPWSQYNQGLANLGQTFQTLNAQDVQRQQLAMQQGAQERQDTLADLQVRQGEATLADTAAKQAGLQKAYGVASPEEAYKKQYQTAQAAEIQKQAADKMKLIMDGFKHFEGAVKDNSMAPDIAKNAFLATMKYGGIDLSNAGINVDFSPAGGFYSGPISKASLVRMNGKVVPYNNDGIVEKMKVVGSDPQTSAPIFEATKDTVFKELAQDQKAFDQIDLGDKVKIIPRDGSKPYFEKKALSPAAQVKISTGGDKTDPIVARTAVKDLQELRQGARQAVVSLDRYDAMQDLLKGGSAGGLKGNLLSKASAFFDTQATSEADLFKKLAQSGAGALRLQTVGPGPVSNYENQLLQAISGGGNGARSATIQLINYYGKEAQRAVDNYNESIDSTATVAPAAAKTFKPITRGGKIAPTVKPKSDPMGLFN